MPKFAMSPKFWKCGWTFTTLLRSGISCKSLRRSWPCSILRTLNGGSRGPTPPVGVESVEAAKHILVNAREAVPNEGMIHFNLACHECVLGNLREARRRLSEAIAIDEGLQPMALHEKDLEPLWDSL